MRTKQPKLGKKLLSLTIMLTTLLTLFAPPSYAQDYYPPGQHWIPTSLLGDITLTMTPGQYGWPEIDSTKIITGVSTIGRPGYGGNYNHPQLREASQKGLISCSGIRVSGNIWCKTVNRQQNAFYLIGTPWSFYWDIKPPVISGSYSYEEYPGFRRACYNGGDALSFNYTFDCGGGIVLRSFDNSGLNVNVTHVLINIAPDTTAIGRVETAVQQLPTTLNNAVTNINSTITNQILGTVQIAVNSPQRTTILSQYGLATTITTNGLYPSNQGGRYRVVFYSPPTNIDQLNLS